MKDELTSPALLHESDDVAARSLEVRDREWRSWLDGRVRALSQTPQGRILAVFDALAEWFHSDDFRGCAFVNAAVETPDLSNPIRLVCRAHKVSVRRYLCGLINEARLQPAERLAADLSLLVDGAIILALVEDDPTAARLARGAAARLLEASMGDAQTYP